MGNKIITAGSFMLVLLFLFFQLSLSAQVKYAPATEKKISDVENNLGIWVQIEGERGYTLQERMAHYHVNGVSIAVIKNYKIEWARAYGWADSVEQRPVTTATLFQAGSISKSLNSVAVLKLVQEGKLNLSADINDYLKTWKFPYDSFSKGKKITIANLLSHTAGLTVHGFRGYEMGEPLPTLIQVLDGAKPANNPPVRSAFEPGIKYQYSGGGTIISQKIVEDVTGRAYDVYMWENVLKPMGMLNSSYSVVPTKEKSGQFATGYYNDGKAIEGKYHIYPEQAAAALWTNPTELSRYIIETQLALQGKSNKVLSQTMTKQQLTPFVDSAAALGVFINKKGEQLYFQHGGVDAGFVSQYYGSLEGGNGVVVMTNTANAAIVPEIINSVATVYGWKDFYQPQVKKVIRLNDHLLDYYIGKYKAGKNEFSIEKDSGNLYLNTNGTKRQLYFTSDTDFFTKEAANAEYRFTKNDQNEVDGIQLRGNNQKANKIL